MKKDLVMGISALILGLAILSCKKSTDDTTTGGGTATVPAVFSSNYKSAVTLSATIQR